VTPVNTCLFLIVIMLIILIVRIPLPPTHFRLISKTPPFHGLKGRRLPSTDLELQLRQAGRHNEKGLWGGAKRPS
jgi:hypothetical protein